MLVRRHAVLDPITGNRVASDTSSSPCRWNPEHLEGGDETILSRVSAYCTLCSRSGCDRSSSLSASGTNRGIGSAGRMVEMACL